MVEFTAVGVQRQLASGIQRRTLAVWLAIVVASSSGCGLKKVALNSVANSLAASGAAYGSDDDPELIKAAAPFSLKLVESLLVELPRHRGLLLTACAGFTQYAYAFVEGSADLVKNDDYGSFVRLQDRSRKMYLRARDYCLRSLELKYPGIGAGLAKNPGTAAALVRKDDVPLLYWTGAAWGKAVSLSLDRPALMGDFPAVHALTTRALALDETFDRGALHEVMIALESVPEAMGGSPERARLHFDRAVTLSAGASASPFVTFARSVSLPRQERDEFVRLLNQALQIDPAADLSRQLQNILAHDQARFLLEHLDDLFLPAETSSRTRRE